MTKIEKIEKIIQDFDEKVKTTKIDKQTKRFMNYLKKNFSDIKTFLEYQENLNK